MGSAGKFPPDDDERASVPMSPPPPAPERLGTGRHRAVTEEEARRAMASSDPDDMSGQVAYAVRLARANRAAIGKPPNAITGETATPGSMWAVLAEVQVLAHKTDATVTAILARLAAGDDTRKGAKEWLSARLDRLVDALLLLALGAVVAYFAGFHR